jgi:F0F1-type ATP synthase membrane subunit b/b'
MNDLVTILNELEKMEDNMRSIGLVLDSLHRINEDYTNSIQAPRILLEEMKSYNSDYLMRLNAIDAEIRDMIGSLNRFDRIVAESIQAAAKEAGSEMISSFRASLKAQEERIGNAVNDMKASSESSARTILNAFERHDQLRIAIEKRISDLVIRIGEVNEYFMNSVDKSNSRLSEAYEGAFSAFDKMQQTTERLYDAYNRYNQNNEMIIGHFQAFKPSNEKLVKNAERFGFYMKLNIGITVVLGITIIIIILAK